MDVYLGTLIFSLNILYALEDEEILKYKAQIFQSQNSLNHQSVLLNLIHLVKCGY